MAKLEQDIVAQTDGDDTLAISQEEASRELSEVKAALAAARELAVTAATNAAKWQAKAQTLELSLAPEDATAWVFDEYRLGVQGLVRDQLQIRSGWEAAVEAGLYGVATGAVMDSIDSAIDALRGAREAQSGHLELLISGAAGGVEKAESVSDPQQDQQIKQARQALRESNFDETEAILGIDALSVNTRTNILAREILEHTILAADLSVARKLLAAGALRVVTLAGDVLTPQHISGGAVQTGAVLARQAMYADALAQEESAAAEKTAADQAVIQAEAKLALAQAEFDQISLQLNARDSSLAAVSAQLGVLRQSVQSAEDEVARNEARQAKIQQEISLAQNELAQLTRSK
ncbi:hypothetical protein RQN46_00620 [Arcanobacterium hippocoleae]